jgi:hypothetical protein
MSDNWPHSEYQKAKRIEEFCFVKTKMLQIISKLALKKEFGRNNCREGHAKKKIYIICPKGIRKKIGCEADNHSNVE